MSGNHTHAHPFLATGETRYVYYVAGHLRVTPQKGAPFNAPFDCIVRAEKPVTSAKDLEKLQESTLAPQLQAELGRADPGSRIDDTIVRSFNLIHTILVEANDPDGEPVRVLS